MVKRFIAMMAAVLTLSSCSPIQHSSSVAQSTNTQLVAGVGDTVLSVTKEKNLPNVFGASDIFGRKTPTGMVTVEYLGVSQGRALFRRYTVEIETGATTMNSTPTVISNNQTTTQSGMIGGTFYNGTSTTYAPPTVIPATQPQAQVLGRRTAEISVGLSKKDKVLIVEGKTIRVISADNAGLVYSISD